MTWRSTSISKSTPGWLAISEEPWRSQEESSLLLHSSSLVSTMADKEDKIYCAKLAEQAERYDGMIWAMNCFKLKLLCWMSE